MTRAVLCCFHKYQPYGGEFYEPILTHFLEQMKRYKNEYDHLYLIDSNWNIPESPDYTVIKVNPSLRYYDAYKEVLPQITEDTVLLMDNDMVVYREEIIGSTFQRLEDHDVVSIYDTIGTMKVDLPNGKNKFCPYWFATRKETLMKYLSVDWSPDKMPYTETLGLLTEAMLKDGLKPYEWEEDKNSIYFDGVQDEETSKNLGYYHIRSGSVPAILLAYKQNDPEQYWKYINEQPKREYLRQLAWYWHMSGDQTAIFSILDDVGVTESEWIMYCIEKFPSYHGLI